MTVNFLKSQGVQSFALLIFVCRESSYLINGFSIQKAINLWVPGDVIKLGETKNITTTNIDLSAVKSFDIHMSVIFKEMLMISVTKSYLKIV